MKPFMIYGATGYTGALAAERAASRNLAPILAGRNPEKVRALGERLGLKTRAFVLDNPSEIRLGLAGASAVLHVAGPFSATSRPMAQACLEAGVHYVDVTGEIDVFEDLAARDADAKARGIALLPGAGFDVVPSDCLAAHVVRRLPDATRLKLSIGAFGGLSSASRGTAKTMLEAAGRGTRARGNGRIVEIPAAAGTVDFGAGSRPTVGVSWGDVSTAFRSTGVPNIDVAFEATPAMRRAASASKPTRILMASQPVQAALGWLIDRAMPPGPLESARASGGSVIVAEAWNDHGGYAASRLRTPEAYGLTAETAVEIARRASAGEIAPGYQTPATAFGPDFILSFEHIDRTDL